MRWMILIEEPCKKNEKSSMLPSSRDKMQFAPSKSPWNMPKICSSYAINHWLQRSLSAGCQSMCFSPEEEGNSESQALSYAVICTV